MQTEHALEVMKKRLDWHQQQAAALSKAVQEVENIVKEFAGEPPEDKEEWDGVFEPTETPPKTEEPSPKERKRRRKIKPRITGENAELLKDSIVAALFRGKTKGRTVVQVTEDLWPLWNDTIDSKEDLYKKVSSHLSTMARKTDRIDRILVRGVGNNKRRPEQEVWTYYIPYQRRAK